MTAVLDLLGYGRLSDEKDDPDLQEDAIDRQVTTGDSLAESRGGRVREWYIDPDNSAYKKRKRPEFERLLRDLPSSDGLVAYDIDRLLRRPDDLERLIAIYEAKPSLIFVQAAGDIDLSTPDGRFHARILVNVANKSSADTARRVAGRHKQIRDRGDNHTGGRPFGWGTNKVALDPLESDAIRDAAPRLLTGTGLHTIAREWNEAGLLTARGNAWQGGTVKAVMVSPRLAGYRVHTPRTPDGKKTASLPQIALDKDGKPIMGKYEPILDVETWEAVRALLTDPARCHDHQGAVKRRYLLSGIARCGKCGGGLVGANRNRDNVHVYHCPSPTNGGCGKVSVQGKHVDAIVTEALLTRWAEGKVEHPVERFHGDGEIANLEDKKAETVRAYDADELPGSVAFPMIKRIESKLVALRKERNAWVTAQAKAGLVPVDLVAEFAGFDLERKRVAIANSKLAAVVIKQPTKKTGRSFDPSRVVLEWED